MHDLRERMHVSRNRLEGSLGDTSIERLLDACHRHLVTGTLEIRAFGGKGHIELRAGAVDDAAFGDLRGRPAVERMTRLTDGVYELVQQLPDLDGELGGAAQFEGEVRELSLVNVMRHCEDNALTCTITLVNEFDRGTIVYRAGEIAEVTFNDTRDDDCIGDLLHMPDARFRVSANALDLDIDGWPSVGREPTAPFRIDHGEDAADDAATEPAREPTDRIVTHHASPAGERPALWFAIGVGAGLAALGLMYVVALLLM